MWSCVLNVKLNVTRWSACQTINAIKLRESYVIIHDLFATLEQNQKKNMY